MKGKLSHSFVAALLAAGALALASCTETTSVTSGPSAGVGPGGGTVLPPGGGTTGASGTRVQLLASNPQIPSAGTTTVDLTAVVLDTNGQAVTGMFVTISTGTDPSAFISGTSNANISDANGVVTGKLNLGSNKTNRVITVTATTSDGASINTTVTVVGTTISVSGTSSLTFGSNTTLTFGLKDSAGIPIPGIQLTVSSANGNGIGPLVPANAITDSAGQVSATITATVAGNDTITASGAGTSKQQTLTVSGASFTFTTPAPSVTIPLNTGTPISIHWTNGGVPVAGQPISFSTTRGAIVGSPATTNGAGDTAGVTISSNTAGPATITATGTGTPPPAATLSVFFVATTASNISAQAIPGTVAVTTNSPTQTNNKSTIQVVVRDAANNLVQNAGVTFTITADPSGGQLAAPNAVTDATGTASVTYTAGSVSSPQNGVIVTVTVTDVGGVPLPPAPAVTDTATLTVSGQSLLVRLGTDNLIQPVPPLDKKTWAAIVTDAAGNAIQGAVVQFALRPGHYRKGFWFVSGGRWIQQITSVPDCNNEDVNFNAILDPGEDFNNNGRLEPGGVATVNPTGTTDASGVALAVITYPKDHAFWTEITLEARTGVTSNDPPTFATFFLEGLASDYLDPNVSPPGQLSPYGVSANCGDTL